jgi:A1 cistron-splicing factor AAR2
MDTTAYDEDDETGEWAPQIVDLTPEQARLLGVEDAVDLRAKMKETSLHARDDGDGLESGAGEVSSRGSVEEEDEDDEEEMGDLEDMDARY